MPETTTISRAEDGLDRLEQTSGDRPRIGRAGLRILAAPLPAIGAVAVMVGVWQLVFSLELQPPSVLPSPAEVAETAVDLARDGSLVEALWVSGSRAVVGFALSVFVGTLLGLALARVRLLRAALGPLVTALLAMPAVAWVPAAIIAFGFTDAAIYSVVLVGAVPSVANGLVAGVDTIPPLLHRAGQVLGARGWTMVRHVLLPAALPGYIAGVRQAWAFAWRSLMAAELIASSPQLGVGVGQLLQQGRTLFDMPRVIVAMGLVLLIGLVVELGVFGPLERRVLRLRGMALR
ncbi:ABC transporter permease [Nocardioides endophyticus]|uniref:ABC transporter permease n=1 Tax=Nocardioides endophyticus TaxID=1353775 RepID=A0ABP8YI58_9ACTN